ncbi:MAG: hypothetical protein ACOVMP_00270 [Chthoniobacterales bacterium]
MEHNGPDDIIEPGTNAATGDNGADSASRVEMDVAPRPGDLEAGKSYSVIKVALYDFERMVDKDAVVIVVECVGNTAIAEKRLERRLDVPLA